MVELAIAVAVGLFAGAMVALRYIAPKTATTKDDELLAKAEKVEPIVNLLKK